MVKAHSDRQKRDEIKFLTLGCWITGSKELQAQVRKLTAEQDSGKGMTADEVKETMAAFKKRQERLKAK